MLAYWLVYKNALSTQLQYRTHLVLILVSHCISLSGLVYLWLAVYAQGDTVGSYALADIIIYYVLLSVIRFTIGDGLGSGLVASDDINKGVITNYIIKPFRYPLEQLIKLCGQLTITSISISFICLICAYIFRSVISLPSFLEFCSLLLFMGIGFLMGFLNYFTAGLVAFWFEQARSVIFTISVLSMLLSGAIIPIDLFPSWYQQVSSFLPFPYLVFYPIQAFLGTISSFVPVASIGLCWIVVLAGLCTLVWKRGLRHFEATGK